MRSLVSLPLAVVSATALLDGPTLRAVVQSIPGGLLASGHSFQELSVSCFRRGRGACSVSVLIFDAADFRASSELLFFCRATADASGRPLSPSCRRCIGLQTALVAAVSFGSVGCFPVLTDTGSLSEPEPLISRSLPRFHLALVAAVGCLLGSIQSSRPSPFGHGSLQPH